MPGALLVSFGGYPYTPSSLMPDNGLANLAGALAEVGVEARILDFGTISTMRQLFPQELTDALKPEAQRLLGGAGGELDDETRAKLRELDAMLGQHQRAQMHAIAEEVADEVRERRPDFVGMKLWNGDGFTGSVIIAEHLREQFPDLPIYGGGPQSSWWGSAIYDRTQAFTCLLDGEGERAIKLLAEHAAGEMPLAEIPGVTFMDGGEPRSNPRGPGLSLDELPEPLYDEESYPALAGDEKLKIFIIDDSRGCPQQCGFCTHPVESGTRLRTASAKVLVDRMERLIEQHGSHAFRFAGSSTPGRLMAEVADEIIARGLDVDFTCFGHFASSRADHFERMAEAGLYAIFFGLESGCQVVLDQAVRKGLDLQEVRGAVERAQKAGIFVVASMIVPLPYDTEETLAESMRLLQEVRPDSVPVQFPGLLPGTPWWNDPEQYGFEFDEAELTDVGLDYKIKLLFPPSMWEPLPYQVGGMSYEEFTKLTMRFVGELEQDGILTSFPDDNALIARCAGMAPREFRDMTRLWCTIGDAEAMGEMVARANAKITGR
ncbi:MAG: B12-binding domain-containing radical SAM protein [Armatimonadota bacterium]